MAIEKRCYDKESIHGLISHSRMRCLAKQEAVGLSKNETSRNAQIISDALQKA